MDAYQALRDEAALALRCAADLHTRFAEGQGVKPGIIPALAESGVEWKSPVSALASRAWDHVYRAWSRRDAADYPGWGMIALEAAQVLDEGAV